MAIVSRFTANGAAMQMPGALTIEAELATIAPLRSLMGKKGIVVTLSGIVLILIGAMYTLANFNYFLAYMRWLIPVAFIVVGLVQIFAANKIVKFTGLISACLGLLILLDVLGKLHWGLVLKLGPVLYATIGIGLLFI
jgi:hypothetical protein